MGVFASTVRAERPMFAVDPKVEQGYMWLQRKLFDLAYSINLLGERRHDVHRRRREGGRSGRRRSKA